MVVGWMNGLFDPCLFFYYDVDDFLSLSCFVRRLCIICLERYPYDEKSSIERA